MTISKGKMHMQAALTGPLLVQKKKKAEKSKKQNYKVIEGLAKSYTIHKTKEYLRLKI